MPKPSRLLDPLPSQHLKQLARRLLRLHRVLHPSPRVRPQDIRPHNARMQNRNHDPLVPQLDRHGLGNLVKRCLGRAVGVAAPRGVVGDGAHPARHKGQPRGRRRGLEDVGEQGLDEEEGPKGIDRKDAREGGVRDGGEGVAVRRVRDAGDVEQEVEGLAAVVAEVGVLEGLDGVWGGDVELGGCAARAGGARERAQSLEAVAVGDVYGVDMVSLPPFDQKMLYLLARSLTREMLSRT